ncbi:hypothetical protein, partial [Acinetobacter indicus]|uniref:hypothetical protein n=1 Tax=Acinetobacter indicus TaxID=756892 RepID=UPI000AD0FC24
MKRNTKIALVMTALPERAIGPTREFDHGRQGMWHQDTAPLPSEQLKAWQKLAPHGEDKSGAAPETLVRKSDENNHPLAAQAPVGGD